MTPPVPAFIAPSDSNCTLLALTVTSVFVTLIGAANESDAVVEVEASNTNETGPVEVRDPGWKSVSLSTTVPDLVAL